MEYFKNISNYENLIIFRTANYYLRFEKISNKCLIAGYFTEDNDWVYIDHIETRSHDPFDLWELVKTELYALESHVKVPPGQTPDEPGFKF